MSDQKDPVRVQAGYKATMNNPRVSDEAKERAAEKVEELAPEVEQTGADRQDSIDAGKNTGNVIGGYKATLKNPNVSDEAKSKAEGVLKEHGAL